MSDERVLKVARDALCQLVYCEKRVKTQYAKTNVPRAIHNLSALIKDLEKSKKPCDCKNVARRRHNLAVRGQTAGTVAFDDLLAGPGGCFFYLFPSPNQKPKALELAKQILRRGRDVVGPIRVIKPCLHEGAS